jgi:hypothetical protein
MTPEELERLQREFAKLSEYSVQQEYKRAYEACRMEGERLPRPRAIQELVQIWKQLWRWRKR